MQEIPTNHPLRRFFVGAVEDAFYARLGLCDPALTAYLAELLVSFTRMDRLDTIRRVKGKGLDQVARMLAVTLDENLASENERDRAAYRHIGDHALFWTGLYPEQLKRVCCDSPDLLLEYVGQGKRCYAIVSELSTEDSEPPSSLFQHLSEDFESCVFGLGLVRRQIEEDDDRIAGRPNDLLY